MDPAHGVCRPLPSHLGIRGWPQPSLRNVSVPRCGRCGRVLMAIDGDRLHCLPCRSEIEHERRTMPKCGVPACHEPAVKSKDGRIRTVCAEHLAMGRIELNATPLQQQVEDARRHAALTNLLRIERELRD